MFRLSARFLEEDIYVTGCPMSHTHQIIGSLMYKVLTKDNASDNIWTLKNWQYQVQYVSLSYV